MIPAHPDPSRADWSGYLVDAAFPSGNVLVERIDAQSVHVRPDQRDTSTPWFYWHFRVRGAADRRLRFIFIDEDVIGTRGSCVSVDVGQNGELLYRPIDNPPFGEDWNVSANYQAGLSFADWTIQHLNARLASTLEVPYANVQHATSTPANLKMLGKELASALRAYLGQPATQ